MTPHIGLNLVYWQRDSGGPGTYARELILALKTVRPDVRLTAWVGTGAPPGLDELPVDWVRLPLKSSGSAAHVGYELGLLGFDARRRGVDVVHGLAYATPFVAPGVATVVTLLDLTWRHQPDSVTRLTRGMFRLMTATCGRTADRIIAISDTVRDDLVATAGIRRERIDVTPLGVRQDPLAEATPARVLRERFDLPEDAPVILCVAQVVAHKNLGALIRALPALPHAQLVIAGRRTSHCDELEALARRLGVQDRLALPGYVEDADLEGLYALATCFAHPSVLEGFGLPLLEAMRRGVPVACSSVSALPEVAGGAARLFDPRDDVSVAAAIGDLVADPALRAELAARGRGRAAELTWERTAEATLASYERALASSRRTGGARTGRSFT